MILSSNSKPQIINEIKVRIILNDELIAKTSSTVILSFIKLL